MDAGGKPPLRTSIASMALLRIDASFLRPFLSTIDQRDQSENPAEMMTTYSLWRREMRSLELSFQVLKEDPDEGTESSFKVVETYPYRRQGLLHSSLNTVDRESELRHVGTVAKIY